MSFAGQSSSPFGAFVESPFHARGGGVDDIYVCGVSMGVRAFRVNADNTGMDELWGHEITTSYKRVMVSDSYVAAVTAAKLVVLDKAAGTLIWSSIPAGVTLFSCFIRGDFYYACGTSGGLPWLRKYDDAGATVWTFTPATGIDAQSMWVDADETVWLNCRTTLGGGSVSKVFEVDSTGVEVSAFTTEDSFRDMWMLSGGDLVMVGGNNVGGTADVIYRYQQDGTLVWDTAGPTPGESLILKVVADSDETELLSGRRLSVASDAWAYVGHQVSNGTVLRSVFVPPSGGGVTPAKIETVDVSQFSTDLFVGGRRCVGGTHNNKNLFRVTRAGVIVWSATVNTSTTDIDDITTQVR